MNPTLSQPTPEKLNEIKSSLAVLLPRAGDAKNDALVEFVIKKVWDDILIYCHLVDFPDALTNTLVEMVFSNMTTYRWLDTQQEVEDGRIKEISEGDVSIKRLTSEEAQKISNTTKGMSIDYYYKLNSYRRLQGWQ